MSVRHANSVILACCVLHNYLRTRTVTYTPEGYGDTIDSEGNILDGAWRADQTNYLAPTRASNSRNGSVAASQVRDILKDYFCNTGAVQWQDAHVRQT